MLTRTYNVIEAALFRSILAASMLLMGLYRLDSPGLSTNLPRVFWGGLLLVGGLGLAVTLQQRSHWRWGRLAALAACVVMGGLGLDLWLANGPGTSSWLPILWAVGALAEGLGHHD